MPAPIRRGFTLIELLIVVAIIAILAAIAVPNFLEAQTRSKVSRAKADMRTLALGLEAYSIDNNGYPWQNTSSRALNRPSLGFSPATGAAPTLERLSTPVAYLTGGSVFQDPFFATKTYQGATLDTLIESSTFPVEDQQSFQSYWYMARRVNASNWGDPSTEKPVWWLLSSAGPDRAQHNLGTFFNSAIIRELETPAALGQTLKMVYDPTNGTVSRGSIWRQGGTPAGTGKVFAKAVSAAN